MFTAHGNCSCQYTKRRYILQEHNYWRLKTEFRTDSKQRQREKMRYIYMGGGGE